MSELSGRWLMQEVKPGAAAFFELQSAAGETRHVMRWLADSWSGVACWVSATPVSWQAWNVVMHGQPLSNLADSSASHEIAIVQPDEARAYLDRLSTCLDGDRATLLTDAEWDAACQLGRKEGFPFLHPDRERPLTEQSQCETTENGLFFAVRHSG